ncbi:MAG: hypothetical protein V4475_01720 [Pseudomonadota bacterium]
MIVPDWTGGDAWADEMARQARVIGCHRSTLLRLRFVGTARLLTPWRVRSSVQCNAAAIEKVLPLLEACRRDCGRRMFEIYAPWSSIELGELLVEARNRATLAAIGRDRPREKGARFDPARIPLEAIDHLIQRHPNMRVVEQLRAERNRRLAA